MSSGLFITFDGPEGGGKTTQRELLSQKLKSLGYDVVDTREPGGTRLGKAIREWLLIPSDIKIAKHAEILLFMADRAQHIEEVVRPALNAGKIVLCDRYIDSTIAYQVGGRGLPLELMEQLNQISHQGLMPTRTYMLMVSPELGLERAQKKGRDEFLRGCIATPPTASVRSPATRRPWPSSARATSWRWRFSPARTAAIPRSR